MKRIIITLMAILIPLTVVYGQSAERMKVLFQEGLQFYRQGNFRQAAQKWEPALEIARSIRNKSFEDALLTNLGIIYRHLGDYPKAISYLKQALKIRKALGDKKRIGDALINLGNVYISLEHYLNAISYFKQTLKIGMEIRDKDIAGAALTGLGICYRHLGDYSEAIFYTELALKFDRELKDKGVDLANLGAVYINLGNYPKAISYLKQALKIYRKIRNKPGAGQALANLEANLGNVYHRLGDYQKAISYYGQALEVYRKIGDKLRVAKIFTNLGVVYEEIYNYPKAISYYKQALKIQKEIGVPTIVVEANIADIWLKMGEVHKAEEIYLGIGWPIKLGELNLVKRNYRKAIEYFEKSLKRALQNRNAELLFADYVGLAQCYEGLKEYTKAKENYEKAITMAEEQREALAPAEKTRFFVAEVMGFKRIQPYEGMVRVLMDFDKAFFYSENLKARVLAEAIARGRFWLQRALPPKLAEEENSYIVRIRGLRRQIETLYKNKAMDTYYRRKKELKEIKAKQQKFIHRLRESYPEYASINYPQPLKPEEVKLRPNEVLIEFEVTDYPTYVFMLKGNKVKIRQVPISREKLREIVLQYRDFFKGVKKTGQLLKYKPEVGKKLYMLLFGDLLQSIPEGNTLIIVPDEFLGILPFEALVTDLSSGAEKWGEGEYGPFPLGVKYLGDKYFISYAQSATALTLLRVIKKGGVSGENVLVVADPIFSTGDPRLRPIARVKTSKEKLSLMDAIAAWKQMGVAGIRARRPRRVTSVADEIFPRLEKTKELAKEIRTLFDNRAKVLLGRDAKEEEVIRSSLSKYRYIIFATHGILDNTVPWIRQPALVLTQVGNPEDYDGFLTMDEVMGLKLKADVVALTACETGLGKIVSGEGVMGMGRAFQFAGAANVIVTLWSVAETSATQFTTAFFKHLREGKEPRQAMKFARNDIRRQGYEHPFYWAAFILIGS